MSETGKNFAFVGLLALVAAILYFGFSFLGMPTPGDDLPPREQLLHDRRP